MPVQSTSGNIIQNVFRTTDSTGNYASYNYQNTEIYCDIALKYSNSRLLIRSLTHFGMADHDVASSCNYHDSAINDVVGPHNTSGGDNNGQSNSRMAGYFGFGSFAGNNTIDNWWLGQIYGEYLYTPSSGSTSSRRISFAVRTSEGRNFRLNMNGQNNTTDPRDVRLVSFMSISEIGR